MDSLKKILLILVFFPIVVFSGMREGGILNSFEGDFPTVALEDPGRAQQNFEDHKKDHPRYFFVCLARDIQGVFFRGWAPIHRRTPIEIQRARMRSSWNALRACHLYSYYPRTCRVTICRIVPF